MKDYEDSFVIAHTYVACCLLFFVLWINHDVLIAPTNLV